MNRAESHGGKARRGRSRRSKKIMVTITVSMERGVNSARGLFVYSPSANTMRPPASYKSSTMRQSMDYSLYIYRL